MRIEGYGESNNCLDMLLDNDAMSPYSESELESQLTYNNLLGLEENIATPNTSQEVNAAVMQNENVMPTQDSNIDEDEIFVLARIGPTLAGMMDSPKSDGTMQIQPQNPENYTSTTNFEEIDKLVLPIINESFGKNHFEENVNNYSMNNNTLSNNIMLASGTSSAGTMINGTTMKTTINLNVNVYISNSTTNITDSSEPNDKFKFTASFLQSLNTKAQVKFDLLEKHPPVSSITCADLTDISEASLYDDFAELIKFPDGIENAFATSQSISAPLDPNKVHYSIQFDGRNIICRTQCGEFVIPRSNYGFAGIKTDRVYAGTTNWPTIQNWQGHPSSEASE